jgi:hypothetical protein
MELESILGLLGRSLENVSIDCTSENGYGHSILTVNTFYTNPKTPRSSGSTIKYFFFFSYSMCITDMIFQVSSLWEEGSQVEGQERQDAVPTLVHVRDEDCTSSTRPSRRLQDRCEFIVLPVYRFWLCVQFGQSRSAEKWGNPRSVAFHGVTDTMKNLGLVACTIQLESNETGVEGCWGFRQTSESGFGRQSLGHWWRFKLWCLFGQMENTPPKTHNSSFVALETVTPDTRWTQIPHRWW